MPAASLQLNSFILAESNPAPAAQDGFLARLARKIQDVQMRRAEQQVARLIEARGGRFTDALERDIERQAL